MDIKLFDKRALWAAAGLLCLPLVSHGQQTWTYTYHPNGEIETADGPRTDVSDITTYTYDENNKVISVTNAIGHITRYPSYDASGRVLQTIDPNGVITDYSYHVRGWLESTTVHAPAGSLLTDAETLYSYDAVGQLIGITLPDNSTLSYEYDGARRLTAIEDALGNRIEYGLDAAGNRTEERIKDGTGTIMYAVSRAFDELSRVMDITGNNSQHDHLDYDLNDNNTAITDGRANSTQQVFDALNRLTQVTDPAQGETHYSYDSQDNLTSVTDPHGLMTTYGYDAFGNLTSVNSPDTGTSTYTYDSAGNRVSAIDNRGKLTTYDYDALNRLTHIQHADNPDQNVTYSYDETSNGNPGIGRLTGISDHSGTTQYSYNHRGQITAKRSTVDGVVALLEYDYNAAGHLTRIIYPSGRQVHYQRDQLGRIAEVTTQADAQSPEQVIATNLSYLPFGPLSAYSTGNGLVTSRAFDRDYRTTHIEVGAADPLLQRLYEYDAVNNITRIDSGQNGALDTSFSYDPLNRLTDALNLEDLFTYSYDSVGNRTETFHNDQHEAYLYEDDNHHLLQRGEQHYQYDAAGNTVANGRYTFDYSDANRLSRVQEQGRVLAEYHYNALGQRVQKLTPGLSTEDYIALAEEQDSLAEQYRRDSASLVSDSELLLSQAQDALAQIKPLERQVDVLQRQVLNAEQRAAQLEERAERSAQAAQDWLQRTAEVESKIVDSPNRQQSKRNDAYRRQADNFATRATAEQARADALYTEAEELRRHEALDTQIADLERQIRELRMAAQQATAEAQAMQAESQELLAQADHAEAQAEDYRLLAIDPPQVTRETSYVYNESGQLLGEYEDSIPLREYIYLNGTPLALASEGEVYYYHNDHLDTPQLLTDSAQQVVWQGSYAPFGQADIVVEEVTNNLRFPGQYFDEETGLHYNYFRDYDPSTGRYIQSDPIGLEGGINTYAYVSGNPINKFDAYGLAEQCVTVFSFPFFDVQACTDDGQDEKDDCDEDGCAELYRKIDIAVNGLQRRLRQLGENKGGINQTTHWEQFKQRQVHLRKLLSQANTKSCLDYRSDAWYWASR